MAPILGIWASSKSTVAADTGAYFPLQVITVGSAGASSVSFTNIPNTYAHLQIRTLARNAGSNTNNLITFNSDSGSNYTYHTLEGNGTSASAGSSTGNVFTLAGKQASSTYGASIFGVGIVDILDYANTNKYTTVRVLAGVDNNGSGDGVIFTSGLWRNTNAITSVTITAGGSGFAQYSSFALYGIKGA